MKKQVHTIAFALLATAMACQSKGGGGSPPPPTDAVAARAPSAAQPAADPTPPPRTTRRRQSIRMEVKNVTVQLASGVTYNAWTFNGGIPGPILRATVGDTIDVTFVNKGTIPHSLDFHAADLAPNKHFPDVIPGDSMRYQWTPKVVGAFLYHCVTSPPAAHVGNGMYGAMIVDPATPRPAAKEIVLVQGDFYLTADSGGKPRSLAWDRLLNSAPDFVTFNGHASQYVEHPIAVPTHQLIRMYVVNAGPNRYSYFHLVGGMFDRVFLDASLKNPLEGVQTVSVPVGGSAIFELHLDEAGDYIFVTHAFSDVAKGASGLLRAGP